MIEIREARTDEELEAWRQVRLAVLPNERAPTLEEIRKAAAAETLHLLALLEGELGGSGLAGPSDTPGRAFVAPRVLPGARRRGVGTALLNVLSGRLVDCGYSLVGATVEDPGSLVFAARFGFREADRQVEQVREIGEEPEPAAPPGINIVSIAVRPELWRAAYDPVALEAFQDMALDAPIHATPEQWDRDWMNWPEATFVAVERGEVVGTAGLMRDGDRPDRAENALTAVRRDRRGRGIASALKRRSLAFAAANGLREIYTWTQRGNEDLRRLNQHLGYATRTESISLRAPLPLV